MQVDERWPRCPDAAEWFNTRMHDLRRLSPTLDQFGNRLLEHSGVELTALVDHWKLPLAEFPASLGGQLGMEPAETDCGIQWCHPGASVPDVLVGPAVMTMPVLRVESIRDFRDSTGWAVVGGAGDDDSGYAEAQFVLDGHAVGVAVRQGQKCCCPGRVTSEFRERLAHARELLSSRDRTGTDVQIISRAQVVSSQVTALLGRDRAADEFFRAERDYYMSRNNAASFQYRLQQDAGIGWANHDHHTYRSARSEFWLLMKLFTSMGFYCREKFFAGAEAGWGAQVMEHPVSRVVLFCDVDMATEDLEVDFDTVELKQLSTLKTIGLWCALHGSSIGVAGMHHLEAVFNFERATHIMVEAGYGIMPAFTDLPMLKQAFTNPELWQVAPERARPLLESGAITREQANSFTRSGAAGSHLEILQRWDGYRGFNKTGVSSIIKATDARTLDGG